MDVALVWGNLTSPFEVVTVVTDTITGIAILDADTVFGAWPR